MPGWMTSSGVTGPSKVANLLLQVFNDPNHPPDVEFGCFAALYGPKGSAFEGQALLRVDIGAGRTGRGKAMPMVVPMSRADVARYDLHERCMSCTVTKRAI